MLTSLSFQAGGGLSVDYVGGFSSTRTFVRQGFWRPLSPTVVRLESDVNGFKNPVSTYRFAVSRNTLRLDLIAGTDWATPGRKTVFFKRGE